MSEVADLIVPNLEVPINALPDGNTKFESPELLAWAKAQDISSGYRGHGEMLGEMPIALLGKVARIGWMRNDPERVGLRILNAYEIKRQERLTILEGNVKVRVKQLGGEIKPKTSSIKSYDFDYAQEAIFSYPSGPDEENRCWYLFTPLLNTAPAPLDK